MSRRSYSRKRKVYKDSEEGEREESEEDGDASNGRKISIIKIFDFKYYFNK